MANKSQIARALGVDLSKKELETKRKHVEEALKEKVKKYGAMNDPFYTALSPSELEELENLETRTELGVSHLARARRKGWSKFGEAFAYDTNAIEGSTVTASEVVGILENKKWPKHRTKDEISETYGSKNFIK